MASSSKPLHTCDSNGIFYSPLGDYDFSLEKWDTMAQLIDHVFTKKFPDSTLIEATSDREITYKQLFETSQCLAKQLQSFGVEKRTILHMVGENCFDWLVVLFASYLCDCIISATHPNSPWPECSRNITTTCSTVLIMTQNCYEKHASKIDHPNLTHLFITEPSGDSFTYTINLNHVPQNQSSKPEYDPDELNGVCQLLLSSGTTGVPKAIKISDKMIIYSCLAIDGNGCLTLESTDVSLVAQPLAHGGGQNLAFLGISFQGPTLVITDYPGTVGLLEITQKHKLTHLLAVPAVINSLAKYEHLNIYNLSSWKCLLTGASTPNFEMINQLKNRIGNPNLKVKNLYGSSENASVVFGTHDTITSKIESIGIASPGIAFKIADLDDSSKFITKPGESGELLIKQPHKFLLYFNAPQKTADSLTYDGFYKTGDLAYFDENYNLYISGRLKDVVKYRGFSVSTAEIEEILMESDLLVDCSVVGKPDEAAFEIPVAFVVLSQLGESKTKKEVSSSLIEFVENSIAEHKKIRGVYFIDEIPRNGFGKVVKNELKLLF